MLSVYGVIFHLFQEILTKKKQLAEAEVAEAEAGWGWDGNFSYYVFRNVKINAYCNSFW